MQTFRTQTRRTALAGLALTALALAGLTAAPVHAQTPVYSDITNFIGQGYAGGGASGTGPTSLVADDITPAAGFAGKAVTSLTFSIANFNSTASTFSPTVEFFNSNGSNSGPGTLFASFTFNPLTVPGGSISLFTFTPPAGSFVLPSGTFWAGESFSGASAATLNNLGQGLYSPPTVGSSQDLFFQSNGPDTMSSSPPGTFQYFGGSPVADFGWAFSVATPAAVPEASTTVSFGLLLALGIGGVMAARKKKAATV